MLIQRQTETTTVTIASGASVSSVVHAAEAAIFGLQTPAALTNTAFTFQVSEDGITFVPLYDTSNAQVSLTVATAEARGYDLPAELAAWLYFRLKGASNEGAARTLIVAAKG